MSFCFVYTIFSKGNGFLWQKNEALTAKIQHAKFSNRDTCTHRHTHTCTHTPHSLGVHNSLKICDKWMTVSRVFFHFWLASYCGLEFSKLLKISENKKRCQMISIPNLPWQQFLHSAKVSFSWLIKAAFRWPFKSGSPPTIILTGPSGTPGLLIISTKHTANPLALTLCPSSHANKVQSLSSFIQVTNTYWPSSMCLASIRN